MGLKYDGLLNLVFQYLQSLYGFPQFEELLEPHKHVFLHPKKTSVVVLMCVPTSVVHKNTLFKGLENWRCYFSKNLASFAPKKKVSRHFWKLQYHSHVGKGHHPDPTRVYQHGSLRCFALDPWYDFRWAERDNSRRCSYFLKGFGVSSN